MARPKEFDPEVALDRAMNLFWEQGYQATSMQDLVDCMGINRGSLYDTFGNKEQLFLKAVDRYCDQQTAGVVDQLSQPGEPKEILRGFFEGVIEHCTAEGPKRGCFLTNATVEVAPHCDKTSGLVAANRKRLEDAMVKLLKRDSRLGNRQRPIARFMLNSLSGMTVTSKSPAKKAELKDIVEVTLSVLD